MLLFEFNWNFKLCTTLKVALMFPRCDTLLLRFSNELIIFWVKRLEEITLSLLNSKKRHQSV